MTGTPEVSFDGKRIPLSCLAPESPGAMPGHREKESRQRAGEAGYFPVLQYTDRRLEEFPFQWTHPLSLRRALDPAVLTSHAA
jgi:hypothetical protein